MKEKKEKKANSAVDLKSVFVEQKWAVPGFVLGEIFMHPLGLVARLLSFKVKREEENWKRENENRTPFDDDFSPQSLCASLFSSA